MNKSVTVIDYGMGNIWSVQSALRYLGCKPVISSNADEVCRADVLVLPGVGSFPRAMNALREKNLEQAIVEAVRTRGRKILGICLGMQLIGSHSTENGWTAGLNLIPVGVDRFSASELRGNKSPHIGFNTVHAPGAGGLYRGLSPAADFYFVHTYRMLPELPEGEAATCRYGVEFLAGFECGNIFGTQFHPEKSQTNGLILLRNFLEQPV